MKRPNANGTLAMLLFPVIAAGTLFAAPADPRLVSLVPPGTQLVAGVCNRTSAGRPESFLVMGRDNLADRRDFIALAGVDPSMVIRQMIFAAGGSDPSKWGEHSILASGRFDQARIFQAAVENGAIVGEFRGFHVLVQHPFERGLGTVKDVRWLAVIDSSVALFGTRSSVQQELDRYLAGSKVDPSLMQRLSRLHHDDATWSVLGMFDADDDMEHAFGSLDPVFANLIHDRKSFQFGVRYGRKVQVEYEVIVPSGSLPQSISNSFTQSSFPQNHKRSSLLPHLDMRGDRASVRGVVKVTTTEYAAWLAGCARTAVTNMGN